MVKIKSGHGHASANLSVAKYVARDVASNVRQISDYINLLLKRNNELVFARLFQHTISQYCYKSTI